MGKSPFNLMILTAINLHVYRAGIPRTATLNYRRVFCTLTWLTPKRQKHVSRMVCSNPKIDRKGRNLEHLGQIHANSILETLLFFLFGVAIDITALAKSYPYSKAVHIPCQDSSGSLENNERPLMVRMRLCDPCQAHLFPCHVLSCPIAHV